MAERILVLGGVRSGKSAVAEGLVRNAAEVIYLATGSPQDAEVAQRIRAHQARRPSGWRSVETRDLLAAIRWAPARSAILIDALGPWLADRMTAYGLWVGAGVDVAPLGEREQAASAALLAEASGFWEAAAAHPGGPVVLVAEESGLGVTPADPSSRRWLDLAGSLLQQLAQHADRVLFTVAGRPIDLPPAPPPASPAAAAGLGFDPLAAPGAPEAALLAHGDRMVPPGAIDFAVNVHGDHPPPHLRRALDAALDGVGRYPSVDAARRAAATRHRRPPAETLIVAGAAEGFRLLVRALRVRRAAIVHPCFTEPELALRAGGVPVVPVLRDPEREWALDPGAVPEGADLVVLGNPNNPTGTLDDPERVSALCRPGRVTLVDEAFADFVEDQSASLAGRSDLPGLVVIRSITKLWAVPGIRAGYLLGPPGLVQRLAAAQQPWPVSAPALAALEVACQDEAYRVRIAREVAQQRGELAAGLGRLPGVRLWPSAANFLLVRVPDGPEIHARLRRDGVAVRPSTFPHLSADHLRITVRDQARQQRLLRALAAALPGRSAASTSVPEPPASQEPRA